MGCVCSCFGFGNSADNQDRSIRSTPAAFISYFLNKYAQILGTGQARPIRSCSTSNNVGLDDGTVATVVSNTDGFHPRCSNLQLGEGTILAHDQKGPDHRHLLKDPEPLLGGSNINQQELVSEQAGRVRNRCCCELSTAHVASSTRSVDYISTSEHDEDVCPTCLEEYAPENPKIVTQCSHHFHLGCIYEWLERSETCPVCSKLMVFDETS